MTIHSQMTTEELMAYKAIIEMAQSQDLRMRIIACAAREGIDQPESWVTQHMWKFAATTGWDESWQYAKDTATINMNPKIGERDDVINDTNIRDRVLELKAATIP